MVARLVAIRGRVQGVGYRDAMVDVAVRLQLLGWVRNRRDGSVEAFVQGPAEAVERIVAWSRHGPPAARVTDVEVRDAACDDALAAFFRLPTA
jgi:acylphosphatase